MATLQHDLFLILGAHELHQRRDYFLLIDEFATFAATSEEAMAHILSQCRKYSVWLVLAHQNWDQASSKLRGALQNCVEWLFHHGDDDAIWIAARAVNYDPYLVKYDTGEPDRVPVFFTPQEQTAAATNTLRGLKRGEAIFKVGNKAVRIQTKRVDDPECSADELAAITERYAELLQIPIGEVATAVDQPDMAPAAPLFPPRLAALDGEVDGA